MDYNKIERGIPYTIPSSLRLEFLKKIEEATGIKYDYLVNYEGKTILFLA